MQKKEDELKRYLSHVDEVKKALKGSESEKKFTDIIGTIHDYISERGNLYSSEDEADKKMAMERTFAMVVNLIALLSYEGIVEINRDRVK